MTTPTNLLPAGKACGDCLRFTRCAAAYQKRADEAQCQFDVSKFEEAPKGGKG